MIHWKHKGIWLAACAVLIFIWAMRPSPERVTTALVEQKPFAEFITEEGLTHLEDTFNVAAPIQGFLRRVELNSGDPVEVGAPLFFMEPMPAPALDARSREQARESVSAAEARLEAARAEYENRQSETRFATNELARFRQLSQEGVISATELERAENNLQRSRSAERAMLAAVGAAQSELDNARIVLAVTEGTRAASEVQALQIPSPIDGVVLRRFRCCEGVVQAGERVVEVGNLEALEVRIDLLSQDAVRVRPGMRVEITRWGGDETLIGTIRRIDPAGFTRVSALGIEEQRVRVFASFVSPPETRQALGEGFRVEARIILWETEQGLVIPSSALFRDGDRWSVFKIQDGRAVQQPVNVIRRSGIETLIDDNLEPGSLVVTHPPRGLRPGQRVQEISR
ncbi:efflux RND transporter periplasmic adaptor subunit [Aliidiomarina sanyensis]|uniref:Efflux transporter periplasmic adaptor subunit n=1 Tax=Aliidiomarina sanyensis TaxID=1249555 RepID=A0A432WN54_9GAMM|nr:HlyD family efflux transporter periplasmic adaptor subunit [Aliidiomarina sanyensis]RUO35223.1 efflux transporter periplasmic adaptor subunit [Aliidiomarina sanyensis]